MDYLKTLTPTYISQLTDCDVIQKILGVLESSLQESKDLQNVVQLQRDEINRLTGEKGKPNIRPKKHKNEDLSSEEERKKATKTKPIGRVSRNYKVKITRTELCNVPIEILPPDAIHKGYTTVIIQDIKIKPDNIEFQIEHYLFPFN